MRNNICKFVTNTTTEKLDIKQFIYESDIDTMKKPRILAFNKAFLITDGSGDVIINDKRFEANKGTLFFGFTGEKFSIEPNDDFCYLYIGFEGARSDVLFRRFGIEADNRIFVGFDGLVPLWYESLSGATDSNIDLAAESVLLYSFSRMAKSANRQSSLINSIYEITDSNFTSPDLSVAHIASMLSYNAKYISHFFKEHTGISYSEYLRNLRIKYAVSLFEHGIDSVKNVAFLSGFTDPLYFSTVFKKVVGMSPAEYKKRM